MVRKALLTLAAVAGLGFAAGTANQVVGQNFGQGVQTVGQNALNEAIGKLKKEELSKVITEAAKVFQETNKALLLLQKGKNDEALKVLQKVDEQLQRLIDQYGLVKLPIDVQFVEFNGITDLKLAQEYNKRVKELIANNDFVDGRFILALLRDEIDVITTYMPLDVYKQAIDLAVKLLEEGKNNAALSALQSALATLEVETVIVPKPILEAQYLLQKAEKVAKVNPTLAESMISKVEYDLKLAVALGYLRSEKDIEPLVKKLEELKKAVMENSPTVGTKFERAKKGVEAVREQATVHQ